jgi:NADH-quinone oxidoreductase subunit A
MNLPSNYLPIAIQLGVALSFVVVTLSATHFLGPKTHGKVKDDTFECGIETHGNARIPFSVKYFLTAILFVLFDVEVIFFYPYAVNFLEMGWNGFLAVLMFVAFFLIGFLYVLKKGGLDWEH